MSVGQELDLKVIRMNEAERKIGLSLKAVAAEVERSRFSGYQRQAVAATSNMEDYMAARKGAGGGEN